jgi:hypothetical protein
MPPLRLSAAVRFALAFGLMLAWLLMHPLPTDRTFLDERLFLDDAAALRAGAPVTRNTEHPPFAKQLIAWAAGSGDMQAAGRLTAALAVATLVGTVFAFAAWAGLGLAPLAALLCAADPVVYTTGLFTNLDGLVAAAYVLSVWLLVWALGTAGAVSTPALAAALFAAGVALGVKWTALTLIPLALFLAVLRVRSWAYVRIPWKSVAAGVLGLAAGYLATYLASGFGPRAFGTSQLEILEFHTYYYLVPRHLASRWYDWLSLTGASWYSVAFARGTWRIFAAVPTPLWLLSLPAALYALVAGVRRRDALRAALGAAIVLQLAMWAVALRQTMLYYMAVIAPFVYLAAAAAVEDLRRLRPRAALAGATVLVVLAVGYAAAVWPLMNLRPFGARREALYFSPPLRRLLVNRALDVDAIRKGAHW